MIVRFFGIAIWKTSFDVVAVLQHWQIISEWNLLSGIPTLSGNLLFVTAHGEQAWLAAPDGSQATMAPQSFTNTFSWGSNP